MYRCLRAFIFSYADSGTECSNVHLNCSGQVLTGIYLSANWVTGPSMEDLEELQK